MKKLQLFCLIILTSLTIQSICAQQVGNTGMPKRGQRGYVPPPRPQGTAIIQPKDVNKEVNFMLPIFVSEFKLDDFQKEIVKGLLIKKFESENALLLDKKVNRDDRKVRFIQIDKNFYQELSSIMTAEDIEIYKLMNFAEFKKEQKKEKRKKHRRKKSKE